MKLTTKYTYIYRIVGVLGCVLVLGSLFMPWVTINDGVLGEYDTGDSPTGWGLANLEKGGNWEENIFAYLFLAIYAFLILAPIGLIIIALGKDARGMGYYLTSMAVFYLILIMFLLPMIQGSIQTPSDPLTGYSTEELDAIRNDQPDVYQKMMQEKEMHDRIVAVKDVELGLGTGLILTLVGGIVTYVGARLAASDAERIADLYKYYILLQEAHKERHITKEAEDLLAMERRIYKITRDEHVMLLQKIFPDERDFNKALDMHDNPVDRDAEILMEHKRDYEMLLREAHKDGRITKEEAELLRAQRKMWGINQRAHEELLWKIFPNEKDFQYAAYQHDKPVDLDRMIMDKELQDYEVFMAQAYRNGKPTEEEEEMLKVIRERLSISMEDHEMVMNYIITEGKADQEVVEIPKKEPPKPEKKEKPEKDTKSSLGDIMGALAEKKPKEKKKKAAPGPPKPKEKPVEPPEKKPAGPPKEPKPRKEKKTPSKVKCTKCGERIPVPDMPKPIKLVCPKCGAKGTIK